jgi:hypothetical protein
MQNQALYRFLIASCAGFIVSTLAIFVAWQNVRDSMQVRPQQWYTQMLLREIDDAITSYQQKSNAVPRSLEQLRDVGKEDRLRFLFENDAVLDGWHRPFHSTFDGTNFLVTSYGRDGKPGGTGLDCDLTNKDPRPSKSSPTFLRFVCEKDLRGMVGTCVVCGVLTFLLSLLTIKPPDLTRQMRFVLARKLVATVIGAAIVTVIISILHFPSGH